MEIIKNGFNTNELIEITCEHCGSVLRCTEEERNHCDCPVCGRPLHTETLYFCENCEHHFSPTSPIEVGTYGEFYTTCPICRQKVYLDDGIDITVDNLKPEHFCYKDNGNYIKFSEIKEWIKEGINFLKQNPDEYFRYTASGDSFVLITREDDEFYVVYTDDYKDVYMK